MSTKLRIFLEPKEQRAEKVNMSPQDNTAKPKRGRKKGSKNSPPKKTKVLCIARTAKGLQCVRSHQEGSDFCGCHMKHCPHGRIDGPYEGQKFLKIPQKRGPRSRNTKQYTLEELNTDLYVKLQLIKIDEEQFLIDENGVVYADSVNGEIVGHQEGDIIKWFI